MIATVALAAAFVTERAVAASAFVDSIGVDTHFAYGDTPYGARFDDVARRLIVLGIAHVRDGVVAGQTLVCRRERALAARGIRFDYVTEPTLRERDLVAWAACVGPAIESFEGPNEYDLSHPASDSAWPQTVRAYVRTLHDAVASAPSLHGLPIIGPSLTSEGAYRTVGDLSPWVDFGNMHDYFGGHEPGTRGWGFDGYGSIAYNLAAARRVSGRKPVVATETGYETDAAPHAVSDAVAAAYVPRMFLDQFAAGVVRTDEYELVDEGPQGYAHFGLLRSDLSPKPAYVALASFIGRLADRGLERTDSLRYAIDATEPGLRHALFEKHDGRFELALWVERPSVGTLAPVTVIVRTPIPARVRAFAYGADEKLHAGAVARSRTTVTLDDRVALVEIDP